MKLFFFLTLTMLIQVSATGYSQMISLQMQDVEIKTVIKTIENQTEYRFFYTDGLADLSKRINMQVNDQNIDKVLSELLSNTQLGYRILENKLVIVAPREAIQQITITGTITDVLGQPMPGVNITIKGSLVGTVSDTNGNYKIAIPNSNTVLVFSFVGYTSQEFSVGDQGVIDIVMSEDTQELEEVVVVGYGTTKKRDLTSAVTHVTSKDFLKVGSLDPAMQLQGKVAGVSITNTGAADPNSKSSLQVRGVTSRAAGLGPLIVIDGVPGGDLLNLNDNDIESIDVLKDGAASAIYGTRGSNGVIMVTTKKGGSVDGSLKASYNGYVAFDFISDKPEMLTSEEFKRYRVADGLGIDFGYNTDWFDAISQTGFTQNHTVTFSGGSLNNNYRITADYRNATGVDIRSDRESYGARLALNHKAKNGLYQVNLNLAPRVIYRNNSDWAMFFQALVINPTMPIMDPNDPTGKKFYEATGWEAINPVEVLSLEQSGAEDKMLDWNGNFQLNLLPLLAANQSSPHLLNTHVTIGQQINDNFDFWFRPSTSTQAIKSGRTGEANRRYTKNLAQSIEWVGNYGFNNVNHHFNLMGGYSYQYFQYSTLFAENKDFSSDLLTYNNLGNGDYQKVEGRNGMESNKNDSKLIAFFGRITYDFQQKYLLTASLRYEGSSKFGINNKWGFFPAASLGWRLSDETFMENATWVNDLKLRADIGITGNQDFDNYRALATMGGYGDVLYNGRWLKGWSPNVNPNSDLKWEKGINWNIGLDFSLMDHRLTGNINYYNRTQKDLLGTYDMPSPPNMFDNIFANVGTMKNTGFEVEANYRVIQHTDFEYTIGIVAATNQNKFVDFSNDTYKGKDYYDVVGMPAPGSPGTIQQIRKGERVGSFFTWRYAGVADDGNWLIYDKDDNVIPIGNGVYDDKRITGNGLPKFTMSINNTFRYKNWDAAVYLRGAFGYDLYNVQKFYWGTMRAAPTNTNCLKIAYTENAAITQGMNQNLDFFLEKGDFLKIDVVSLGYTFRFSNPWIESLRLYCTTKNLWTFTSFEGIDPEAYPVNGLYPGVTNDGSSGYKNYYPRTRQILFGLQVNF